MGKLTTHVLDTAAGRPGAGIRIELFRLTPARERLTACVTNADGRCDGPILEGEGFCAGEYELLFYVGEYFAAQGVGVGVGVGAVSPAPRFLDRVPVRFGVSEADGHYHVPLLVSPYGYSSYRGS